MDKKKMERSKWYLGGLVAILSLFLFVVFATENGTEADAASVSWSDYEKAFVYRDTGLTEWTGSRTTLSSADLTEKVINYDGKEVDAYAVTTAGQLAYAIVNNLNVKIMNDLDLGGRSGRNWASSSGVSSNTVSKEMTIDGNGKTIYNMYISATSLYCGLVPQVTTEAFLIKDLTVSNSYVKSTRDGVAVISGGFRGGNASNVHVTDAVLTARYFAGGFASNGIAGITVGKTKNTFDNCSTERVHVKANRCASNFINLLNNIEVTNCYSIDGTVFESSGHSGGFISCTYGGGVIKNCFSNVEVYGTYGTGAFLGILHSTGSDSKHWDVDNCYTCGKVEGDRRLGGFIAGVEAMTYGSINITNCYTTAAVGMESGDTADTGGFIGQGVSGYASQYKRVNIKNSYAAGEVGADTTSTTSGTTYGFSAITNPTYVNNFYDKQVTAMKERGSVKAEAGITGVLTQDLMNTHPDGEKAEDSAWNVTEGAYPQLNVFMEAEDFNEDVRSMVRTYSQASVSTAILYPSFLEADEYKEAVANDASDYDTVRSIRYSFPMTNNALVGSDAEAGDYDIRWTTDGATSAVSDLTGVEVITLSEYPEYRVTGTAPGISWMTVEVGLNDGTGVKGSRSMRLVPRTSLTLTEAADTLYYPGSNADDSKLAEVYRKYNISEGINLVTIEEGKSFANGEVTKIPADTEFKKGSDSGGDYLYIDANDVSALKGAVKVTVKDADGKTVSLSDSFIAFLQGKANATAADEGSYTIVYQWYVNGLESSAGKIESNRWLTVKKTHDLTYHYGQEEGGSLNTKTKKDSQPYLDGARPLKENVPSGAEVEIENHDFVGWATMDPYAPDSGIDPDTFSATHKAWFDADNPQQELDGDLDIYAVYKADYVYVRYLGNGLEKGTVPTDGKGYFVGDTVAFISPYEQSGQFERQYYKFAGWQVQMANGSAGPGSGWDSDQNSFTNTGFKITDDMADPVTGLITINAQWTSDGSNQTILKTAENETSTDGFTRVGDTILYTIKMGNSADAFDEDNYWEIKSLTDIMPEGVDFVDGSLYLKQIQHKFVDGQVTSETEVKDPMDPERYTVLYPGESGDPNLRILFYPDGNKIPGQEGIRFWPGGEVVITFRAVVNDSALNDGVDIGNKATGIAIYVDSDPEDPDGVETNEIYPPGGEKVLPAKPDHSLSKTVENISSQSGRTVVGDRLKYTITASNADTSSKTTSLWQNVTITDKVPEYLVVDEESVKLHYNGSEYTGDDIPVTVANNAIQVTIPKIYNGEAYQLEFIAEAAAQAAGAQAADLKNTADAAGTDASGYVPFTATASADIPGGAVTWNEVDLSVDKSVVNNTRGEADTRVGDELSYTINVRNEAAGSVWEDVQLTDVLPKGADLVSGSVVLINNSGNVLYESSWYDKRNDTETLKIPLGDMEGGEWYRLTFDAVVNESAVGKTDAEYIGNKAVAEGKDRATGSAASDSSDVVFPPLAADGVLDEDKLPEVTKEVKNLTGLAAYADEQEDSGREADAGGPSYVGDILEYKITIRNPADARPWYGVNVTDVLPATLELDEATLKADVKDGTVKNGAVSFKAVPAEEDSDETIVISYTADAIEPGALVEITFKAKIGIGAVEGYNGNSVEATGKDEEGNTKEPDPNPTVPVYPPDERGETELPSVVRYTDPDPKLILEVTNLTSEGASEEGGREETGENRRTYVGDTLEYRAIVTNKGDESSAWVDIYLENALPDELEFVSGSIAYTSVPQDIRDVSREDEAYYFSQYHRMQFDSNRPILKDEEYWITYKVTVTDAAIGADLGSIVTGDGASSGGKTYYTESEPAYPPGTDENGGVLPIPAEPSLEKTVVNENGADETKVGDTLIYTITAENKKAETVWKDVVISDEFPAGLTYVSGSLKIKGVTDNALQDISEAQEGSYLSQNRDALKYEAGNIGGGESVQVQFGVTVGNQAAESAANIDNVAKAVWPGEDGDNEEKTDPVPPPGGKAEWEKPEAGITKSYENITRGDVAYAKAGDVLRYTIAVSNAKKHSVWKNVEVTDELPEGVDYLEGTLRLIYPDGRSSALSDSAYAAAEHTLTYRIGSIYGGETYRLVFDVELNDRAVNSDIGNTAAAEGEDGDGNKVKPEPPEKTGPPDVYDRDGEPVLKKEVENLDRTDGTTWLYDRLQYTITASNPEEPPGTDWLKVIITDELPEGLTFEPGSIEILAPGATDYVAGADSLYKEGTITYTVARVQPGETAAIRFVAVVNEAATEEPVKVGNSVRATGENEDGDDKDVDPIAPVYPPGVRPGNEEDDEDEGDKVQWNIPQPAARISMANLTYPDAWYIHEGDAVQFTAHISNTAANSIWKAVAVTYELPSGLDYSSAKLYDPDGNEMSDVTVTHASGTITADIPAVSSDEIYKLVIKADVNTSAHEYTDGPDESVMINTVSATGTDIDGDKEYQAKASWKPASEVHEEHDVAMIAKGVSNLTNPEGPTYVGDILEYRLSVYNPACADVLEPIDAVLSDTLPEGVDFIPGTIQIKGPEDEEAAAADESEEARYYADGVISYSVTGIAGGESASIRFQAVVNDNAYIREGDWDDQKETLIGNTVTAEVERDGTEIEPEPDPVPPVYPPGENGEEEGKTPIYYNDPEPSVTKTLVEPTDKDVTYAGDVLKYRLAMANTSDTVSLWKNAVMSDMLPAGLTYAGDIKVTDSDGNGTVTAYYNETQRTIYFGVDEILNGEEYSITFSVTVNDEAVGNEQNARNYATGNGENSKGEETGEESTENVDPPGGRVVYPDAEQKIAMKVSNLTAAERGEESETVRVHDLLEYEITLENASDNQKSAWLDVAIADQLPDGLTYQEDTLSVSGPVLPQRSLLGNITLVSEISNRASLDFDNNSLSGVITEIWGQTSYVITFKAAVNKEALTDAGRDIGNQASGEGYHSNGEPAVAQTDTIYPTGADENGGVLPALPDPHIVKTVVNDTAADGQTYIGDTLKYTITLTNRREDSLWSGAVMTDVLPDGMGLVTDTLKLTGPDGEQVPDGIAATHNEGKTVITAEVAAIYGGESYTAEFDAIVNEKAAESSQHVKNSASVTVPGEEDIETPDIYPPGVDPDDEDKGVKWRDPQPYLTKDYIRLTGEEEQARVGDTLRYTITAGNKAEHSVWENVTVTDQLPEGITFIPGSLYVTSPGNAGGIYDDSFYQDGTITCLLGDIYYGDTYQIVFDAVINEKAEESGAGNTASARGDNGEEVSTGEPAGPDEVWPEGEDPTIRKIVENLTSSDGNTYVGDTLRYTIGVSNPEKGTAWEDVVITDQLPDGLTFVSGSIQIRLPGDSVYAPVSDEEHYDAETGTITWEAGTLAPGTQVYIRFQATVSEKAADAAENVMNTASAASGDGGEITTPPVYPPGVDPDDEDKGVKWRDPLASVNLKIENATYPGTAVTHGGDILRYTVTINNEQAESLWEDVNLEMDLAEAVQYYEAEGYSAILILPDGSETALTAGTAAGLSFEIGDVHGKQEYQAVFYAMVDNDRLKDGSGYQIPHEDIANEAVAAGTSQSGKNITATSGKVYLTTPVHEEDRNAIIAKQVKNLDHENGPTYVGDILEYTLSVYNPSCAQFPIKSVTLEDELPAGVTFIPGSIAITGPSGAAVTTGTDQYYADGKVTYTAENIAAGDSVQVVFQAAVNEAAVHDNAEDTREAVGNVLTVTDLESEDDITAEPDDKTPPVYPPGDGGEEEGETPIRYRDPDPSISKTVVNNTAAEQGKAGPTYVGDELTYTITVTNQEPQSLWLNAMITDDLPEGLTYIPGSMTAGRSGEVPSGLDDSGYKDGTISYTIPAVAGGESYELKFKVTVNDKAAEGNKYVKNLASVTVPGEDGDDVITTEPPVYPPDENGASDGGEDGDDGTDIRYREPVPYIWKSVVNTSGSKQTTVGDVLSYTIELKTTAPHSRWMQVVMTDELPAGVTLAEGTLKLYRNEEEAAEAELAYEDGMLRAEIPEITYGESYYIRFDAVVNETAVKKTAEETAAATGNQASVTGLTPGGNETGPDTTAPVYPPDLGDGNDGLDGGDGGGLVKAKDPGPWIRKSAANITTPGGPVYAGDEIRYMLTFGNDEPDSTWKQVVVRDMLPEGVVPDTDSIVLTAPDGKNTKVSADSYLADEHIVEVEIGDIEYGEVWTLSFIAAVTADAIGSDIGNDAGAWDDDGFVKIPGLVYPDGDESPVLPARPDPEVTKEVENQTHQDGDTHQGDQLIYTITVMNKAEHSLWQDVTITDRLPEGLDLDTGSMKLISPDGSSAAVPAEAYDEETRVLEIGITEINGKEQYQLVYQVMVNAREVEDPADQPGIVNRVSVTGNDAGGAEVTDVPDASATVSYPVDAVKAAAPAASDNTGEETGNRRTGARTGDTRTFIFFVILLLLSAAAAGYEYRKNYRKSR